MLSAAYKCVRWIVDNRRSFIKTRSVVNRTEAGGTPSFIVY